MCEGLRAAGGCFEPEPRESRFKAMFNGARIAGLVHPCGAAGYDPQSRQRLRKLCWSVSGKDGTWPAPAALPSTEPSASPQPLAPRGAPRLLAPAWARPPRAPESRMTHLGLGRERKACICKLAREALPCDVGGMYYILRQSSSALFSSSPPLRAG